MENKFGKTSRLHITGAFKDGKTILEDVEFTSPFKIMRPFYEKKDMMTVMLLSASAGIMAGDKQEFDIKVKQGAVMEFVSQAYEKIHRMEEGFAQRKTYIEVDSGAALHYTPLPAIPFAGSDFRSSIDVRLADNTSEFILRDILTCGRVSHGEEFGYSRFKNSVSIYQKDMPVYMDNTLYEPKHMDMRGFGMYEGFTHLANLVICNVKKYEDAVSSMRELIDDEDDVEGGVTVTAAGHIAVKILGRSGQKLTALTERLLAL